MIERLEAIVREAGEHMLAFQNPKTFVKEGHYNFVTEADLFVESFLIERIQPLAPGACFYAEEQDNQALTDSPTWVIDPIDGTTNYMRGRGVSSISVALLEGKEPVLGMVYDPYKEELFLAEKGKGATRNGQAIHVSDTPFERALVCFGTSPYDASLARKTTSLLWPFLRDAGDLRRCGSAALDLCDLACGRSDVFFELKLSPWDFAAGGLIGRLFPPAGQARAPVWNAVPHPGHESPLSGGRAGHTQRGGGMTCKWKPRTEPCACRPFSRTEPRALCAAWTREICGKARCQAW